ncbi:MAG: winged helix-turn-helix domain-containing protein, partial [Boseongicola sp.]|nr:winged helix-turn-helix domain-containing protein [Boseongicola sp.]
MAVLLHLIERHGEVVSREELLDAVWPGIHVGDDSLTAAIIKIRRALGDDARNPTHIETIPKRGYRLISPLGTSDAHQPAAKEIVETTKAERFGRWSLPVFVTLVVILGAGLFTIFPSDDIQEQSSTPADTSTIVEVMPFANVSGDPAQEYLALGISETILNDLAHHSEFSVRQELENTTPSTK